MSDARDTLDIVAGKINVQADCPNDYPPIDSLPSMADSARPFRDLAAHCANDEVDEFLSLVNSVGRAAA